MHNTFYIIFYMWKYNQTIKSVSHITKVYYNNAKQGHNNPLNKGSDLLCSKKSRSFSVIGLCHFFYVFIFNNWKTLRHKDKWVFGKEDTVSFNKWFHKVKRHNPSKVMIYTIKYTGHIIPTLVTTHTSHNTTL